MALPDFVPTLLRLGAMDAELVGAPQPTHLVRDASIVLDLLNLGLEALQPWPGSFHCFLARLAERASLRGGRYGARRDFGAGTTWLSRLDDTSPVGRWLGPEVGRFLDRHICPRATRIARGVLAAGSGHTTLSEAARELGCSKPALRAVLRRSGIAVPSHGPGSPILLPTALIGALAADRDDLVGVRAAARELGVRRDRVRAALGTLGILRDDRPAARLIPEAVWSRTAICRAVEAHAPMRTPAGRAKDGITFGMAAGRLVREGRSWDEACALLLGNGIKAVGVDPRRAGLAGLLFSMDDLEAVRRPPAGLSITEAGAALGVNSELAHLLVNRGLLAVERESRGRRVTADALGQFREIYVLPGQLGLDAGRHRGWAAARLLAAGCRPVLGPATGSRHVVFRRSEVSGVIAGIR